MPRPSRAGRREMPAPSDADAGIAEDGGEAIDLQRHRRIAADEGAMRGGDDDLACVLGADQRGRVDQHDAPAPSGLVEHAPGLAARLGIAIAGARGDEAEAASRQAMPGATPSARASALAWLTTPRAIMSAASPMRQLAWEAVAAATPSASAMARTAMPGLVLADAGIVVDDGAGVRLEREIGGIAPAVRAGDDHGAPGVRPQLGGRVGEDDGIRQVGLRHVHSRAWVSDPLGRIPYLKARESCAKVSDPEGLIPARAVRTSYGAVERDDGRRGDGALLKAFNAGPMFGMGGFQLLAFYDAARRLKLDHHLINDERCGVFAADAYAKVSGRVGLVDATLGPGATNLVTGLIEALNAGTPLVAFVGDAHRAHAWKNMTQEARQTEILRPACKDLLRIEHTSRIPELIRRAFLIATSGRPGPVVVDVPEDVCHGTLPFEEEEFAVDARYEAAPAIRCRPAADDTARAAALLAKAKRPLMLCGGGVHISQAAADVTRVRPRQCHARRPHHDRQGGDRLHRSA